MTAAICTLFEGHYHLGTAALINSLHASGFRGRFICGYRGALPFWAEPATAEGTARVRRFPDGLELWFVPVEASVHFTNYKPSFMLDMWDGPAASAETFYYFDPDIVAKCPWEVLQRWAEGGIGLCEDVNFYLPARHPLRLGWKAWLAAQGLSLAAPDLSRYYSAGFIGVPREHIDLLRLWRDLIVRIAEGTDALQVLKQGHPTALFHTPDQDAMNIALMASGAPINGVGPEGMDFAPGGHMLSHAIGGRKPWRGGFVRHALQGYPPSAAAKAFFDYVETPIPVFPAAERRSLKRSAKIAAFIGRFYRRA